jgi:hypothetical protein
LYAGAGISTAPAADTWLIPAAWHAESTGEYAAGRNMLGHEGAGG